MVRRIVSATVVLVAGWASLVWAQVKLEHKFAEGSDARFQVVAKTHQVLDISGMKVETQAEEMTTVHWAVGTRDPDGTLPVRQTVESIRVQLDLPGGLSLSFDSANPDAKEDNPQLAVFRDIFKAAVGMEVTFLLDKDNQVKAVEGTEKALSKVNELNPAAAEQLKNRLDPEKLKAAFAQLVGSLPPVLVRTGDTWDRTEVFPISGGQSLTFQKRYEYLGTVEQDGVTLDKIGVRAQGVTYAMDPDAPSPVKVGKSDLKVESSDGTILFDRQKGMPVEGQGVTRITGEMSLLAGGQELPTKLDLTLDIATKRLK
jgi:Family of unknown function (DUF6263)